MVITGFLMIISKDTWKFPNIIIPYEFILGSVPFLSVRRCPRNKNNVTMYLCPLHQHLTLLNVTRIGYYTYHWYWYTVSQIHWEIGSVVQ
jgi:hypothetical protein